MQSEVRTTSEPFSPVNLPLGNSSFSVIRHSDKIYVDKTKFVYELARHQSVAYFLTRPRRFGKSLLVSTFESLFKNGVEDFKDLYIEDKWIDHKKFYVLKLDFSTISQFEDVSSFEKLLAHHLSLRMRKSEADFNPCNENNCTDNFEDWLAQKENGSVVLLIDEYDTPLTSCLDRPDLLDEAKGALDSFYCKIKRMERIFRFIFITGITKFGETKVISSLSNFDDLTLSPNFGTILGFTSQEIKDYFYPFLESSGQKHGLTPEVLLHQLENQYGGYCFEEGCKQTVFAPWPVLNYFYSPNRGFKSYWIASGGDASTLQKHLKDADLDRPNAYFKPKFLSYGQLASSNPNLFHPNDLSLLVQSGYLTLKSRSSTNFEVGYPNKEVANYLAFIYRDQLMAGRTLGEIGVSSFPEYLQQGNPDQVVSNLNEILLSLDSPKYPITDESTCKNYIRLILTLGGDVRACNELHHALGKCDIELETPETHWVFEVRLLGFYKEAKDVIQNIGEEEVSKKQCKLEGKPDAEGRPLIHLSLVYSPWQRQIVEWTLMK